jgi:hypothetical protein
MPNRFLHERICTSETIAALSADEEVFFYRLLVQCDDFGRFDARPAVLRARCFPLQLDRAPESSIVAWMGTLERVGLLWRYQHNGRPYLQVRTWANFQEIRAQKSKFPAPPSDVDAPREHPVPSERDVEDVVHDLLQTAGTIAGNKIVELHRQMRTQESYLDIVAKTRIGTFVLELKRGRLSNKAIAQVQRYAEMTNGIPALIGCGLAANFDLADCRQRDIAVITYDDALVFTVIQPSSRLSAIPELVASVISRDSTLPSTTYSYSSNDIRDPVNVGFAKIDEAVTPPASPPEAPESITPIAKPTKATVGNPRVQALVDGLTAAGVEYVPTPADCKALKHSSGVPVDRIVTGIVKVKRGEWGDDWFRDNLSVPLVIGRINGIPNGTHARAGPKRTSRIPDGDDLSEFDQFMDTTAHLLEDA